MRSLVNIKAMIKSLKQKGLVIDDEQRLRKYISFYNYHTLIDGYSDIFLDSQKQNRYLKDASSNQIIDFYKFDINFSNHLLRFLLRIEKKLNTLLAYTIIDTYQIIDKCLLKLNPDYLKKKVFKNLDTTSADYTHETFFGQLTKYLKLNEETKKYEVKNAKGDMEKWKEVPLDLMCLTWSFSVTFTAFCSLDELLADQITSQFGLGSKNTSGFIDFINNCIYLRNIISHGFSLYNAKIKYQSVALNKLYQDIFNIKVKTITLYEMLKLIEFFTNEKDFISKTLYHFNKTSINDQFKQRINFLKK